MRKNRFIFFLIFTSLIIFAEQKDNEYCEINHREPVGAAWKKCEGKLVKITGKISNFALQHPTGMHDTFDPEAKEAKRKYETYIDTGTSQIVITSDEKIECSGDIEVEGIVDIVDLGGEEGTKTSYKNVWIQVQSYRCK
ncbi:hypothetical protein DENIS_0666 [Desulfonema ishimotonii]|uniref:DUF5666 domain-containing protein n=1 Tax=Desulfonema ishimotonii TaxID=45657 RepID=A0A401FRY6_9BACT|nr:hypothetical protein [Desulfonema ishimotonii]GBC59725.1 hypothetical protein DENIS_0666 [Desulfonema ishimotonii]